MPYTPQQEAVLKKYRIMLQDGTLRMVDLRQPTTAGGYPPGPGPLISTDAINRLLAADTSPNQVWLDWIFFQAGGGINAKEATAEALRQIRDRFIDERTNGWTHPETGIFQQPVPREQAEARWVAAESRFREVLAVCDQDAAKRLRTFGYFRDWPGDQNRYVTVVDAVKNYLKFYKKLLVMNRELVRSGGEVLASEPAGIPAVEDMIGITKKVDRYFASKKARTDVRYELIYEDDIIRALAPYTYAAAVHYGYDLWPWASRKSFEQVLGGEHQDWRFQDVWKQKTSTGSFIIYLSFKGPVPAWVTRRDGTWEVKDLADLALELNKQHVRDNTDEWTVYDQENRNTLTVGQIKQMIMDEPTRQDPAEQETPYGRGPNVYNTAEEAQRVVNSLDRALGSIKKWLAKVDPAKIKSDVLTLENPKKTARA
jgi:hypothetical protein